MDEHSLQTVYEWIADRTQGLEVLVVGSGGDEGPATLARRAQLVFVYERDREIVADASYRYGHVSNLYFSTGGPSEALREAMNFDVVVAIESAVPKGWMRRLGEQARTGGRPRTVVTRKLNDSAQPKAFSYRTPIRVWGHRVTSVGSSPAGMAESFDWGEPIAELVVASNHPLDDRWETTHQSDTPDVEPDHVRGIDEWRAAQELRQAQAELDAVLDDRAIRLVLNGVKALRKIRRMIGKKEEDTPPSGLELINRAVVERKIRALRSDRGPEDGPLVSIIILTRDGAAVLSRLLRALEDNTVYRSFEVVVVDNGSSDETGSLLDNTVWTYPLRVLRNPGNEPFSEGCNVGAEMAEGELLLFLNNDVEPINEGWLGAMVASISGSDVPSAIGALLIHPEIHPKLRVPFPVQHRGVEFRWRDGRPVGVHIGVGDDPTDPAFRFDEKVPALTGACLLVRREDFEKVGRFTTGYVYGLEDVDLCLKLREAGVEMRLCGAAALFHKESTTQSRAGASIRNTKRLTNAHLFDERWKAP
ncbi:MAG TPA: glycosyltransferase family 2 protein, partial [Acidimicrobiia bacterium]